MSWVGGSGGKRRAGKQQKWAASAGRERNEVTWGTQQGRSGSMPAAARLHPRCGAWWKASCVEQPAGTQQKERALVWNLGSHVRVRTQ